MASLYFIGILFLKRIGENNDDSDVFVSITILKQDNPQKLFTPSVFLNTNFVKR
jgi:hypothetical protein